MKAPREQLLGYLLGALDDAEQKEVERQIEHDPELATQLESLHSTLQPLAESCEQHRPPTNLAERTCALVAQYASVESVALPGSSPSPSVAQPALSAPRRFTPADAVVAAGIFLAAGLLFFPAISNSRYLAELSQCGHNLGQVGLALASYSDKVGGGHYPCVPTEGPRGFSGVYSSILQDYGYLNDPSLILCPASRLASHRDDFRIPTLDEIDRADRLSIVWIRRMAGGSYGYSLGFVIDGRHGWPRHQGRAHFAIMADAPNPSSVDLRSLNHGGRGQNLLYDDGHVRFVVECLDEDCLDHPFQNHFGRLEAGVNENDAVVAPSFASPFSQAVSHREIDP